MSASKPELKNLKLCYTVDEAARALGVSRVTIYNKINAGELQAFKMYGRRLLTAETLQGAVDKALAESVA